MVDSSRRGFHRLGRVTAGVAAAVLGILAFTATPSVAGPTVTYPALPSTADMSIALGANVKIMAVERSSGYVVVGKDARRVYSTATGLYGLRNTPVNRAAASVAKSSTRGITVFFNEYGGQAIGTVEPTQILVDSNVQKVIAGVASLPGLRKTGAQFWGVEDYRRTADGKRLVAGACYKPGVEPAEGEELARLTRCAARVAIATSNAQNG